MNKRCKQTVYGERVTSWQCPRAAGYGPNGDYCKQHSARHEKVAATLTVWRLQRRYGDGLPEPIRVRSVTTNSYIDEQGRRNSKFTEYQDTFDTEEEAVKEAIARAERRIASAKQEIAAQEKLLAELRKP